MSVDGTRAESDLQPPNPNQQVLSKAVHLHRLFGVRWELSWPAIRIAQIKLK